MPRPRKPTAILEAKGAFRKDPQRARPFEPQSDSPLGGPPKRLSLEEKKLWREIKRRVLPGVAKISDRDSFEALVKLTMRMRTAIEAMRSAELAMLTTLWSRFAMTPADRSKVIVTDKPESKLDAFMRRQTAAALPAPLVDAHKVQ